MGILYKLFRAGRMPKFVRDEIAGERVLFQVEGIRVSLHESGHVPGKYVTGGVNVGWGAFAVTDRRVIGSRGRAKWLDVPYEQPVEGPATFILDPTGLHVLFDLDRMGHESMSGSMRVDFKQPFTEQDLARFPVRQLSFPVDPQKVVRLFGSLLKLKD
jgi:hypothetical protein